MADEMDRLRRIAQDPVKHMDTITLLEQLKSQAEAVQIGKRGKASTYEWDLANVLACVLAILIDDRRRAERIPS